MAKYTKGPWHYESNGNGPANKRRDQYVVSYNLLERIATVDTGNYKDAHLIAATPQLLEAMTDLMVLAEQYLLDPKRTLDEQQVNAAILDAKRALHKATGDF